MAHQLTIRYDEEIARKIDALAKREGISHNKAVGRLLRRGAGLVENAEDQDVIGDALDWFVGSWSQEQADEFEEVTAGFEMTDEDLWT